MGGLLEHWRVIRRPSQAFASHRIVPLRRTFGEEVIAHYKPTQ